MAAEAGEVVWHKGTERIQPSGHFEVVSQGRQQMLVIKGFRTEDQGEYRCGPAQGPDSTQAATFQGVSWALRWEVRGYGEGAGLAILLTSSLEEMLRVFSMTPHNVEGLFS